MTRYIATGYDSEDQVHRIAESSDDFSECEYEAKNMAVMFGWDGFVFEQSGRNPPEILCVWSANP